MGNYTEAIEAYNKTIELDPKFSLAWYNRACVYSFITDTGQSISDLRYAVEINPAYLEMAKADSKFKNLWGTKEFKKLLNSIVICALTSIETSSLNAHLLSIILILISQSLFIKFKTKNL